MRIDLDVPFSDKEQARDMGAKWDGDLGTWFAPNGEPALVKKWPMKPGLERLAGEDTQFMGNFLFADLLPRGCTLNNIRFDLEPESWDRLSKLLFKRANNRCECCHTDEKLEAHERWAFDIKKQLMSLKRIILLCHACHQTTHIDYATKQGKEREARQHLMRVNGYDQKEAWDHINEAKEIQEELNQFTWKMDISLLTNNGLKLKKKR